MPDTAIPVIPTVPVTPAVLDALRAIVGEKGLILDDSRQAAVRDATGAARWSAARLSSCVRPTPTKSPGW